MKTLILVRHAKSSWKHNVDDKERPLKNRGNTDAELVSIALKYRDLELDQIYSSPANRALSTCKIFINNLNIENDKIIIENNLYSSCVIQK